MTEPLKLPKIPHLYELSWDERMSFADEVLIITEKIDGANVCLWNGEVHARSAPGPWLGMVKKHHAYKTKGCDVLALYGEDIYGVHSIEYDPVSEWETFHLFATVGLQSKSVFAWESTVRNSRDFGHPGDEWKRRGFNMVPTITTGKWEDVYTISDYLFHLQRETESKIGPTREGIVVRKAGAFMLDDINRNMFKMVRTGHVQPGAEHWKKNWTKCKIKEGEGGRTEEEPEW